MSTHLPECDEAWNHTFTEAEPCGICSALRACEQRVRAEIEADGPWFRTVVHQCCEDKQTAFAAGLAAAREAVDAVNPNAPGGNMDYGVNVQRRALAAIDALTKEGL